MHATIFVKLLSDLFKSIDVAGVGGGELLAEDIAQLLRSCSILLHLQLSVLVPVNGWLCQKPRLKFHFWEATAVSKLILSKTQVHLRKAGKLNLV